MLKKVIVLSTLAAILVSFCFISATGAVPGKGTQVTIASEKGDAAQLGSIVLNAPDGNLIVVWKSDLQDESGSLTPMVGTLTHRLFAQKFTPDGIKVWANPVALSDREIPAAGGLTSTLYKAAITSDGGVALYYTLGDAENGLIYIKASKADANGTLKFKSKLAVTLDESKGHKLDCCDIVPAPNGAINLVYSDAYNDGMSTSYLILSKTIDAQGTLGLSIELFNSSLNAAESVKAIPDGANGFYLAWRNIDSENGGVYSILLRRYDGNRSSVWLDVNNDTLTVTVASNLLLSQYELSDMTLDTYGATPGPILSYARYDTNQLSYDGIWGRKVNAATGALLWAADQGDGALIYSFLGDQLVSTVVPDGSGGVVVGWLEYAAKDNASVKALRVDQDGAAVWDKAAAVCTIMGAKSRLKLSAAGEGKTYFAWQDARYDLVNDTDYDIFSQLALADGKLGWQTGGLPVVQSLGVQSALSMVTTSVGDLFALWSDSRKYPTQDKPTELMYDLYGQKITQSGVIAWANGKEWVADKTTRPQIFPAAAEYPDGSGVVWMDLRNGVSQIYFSTFKKDGAILTSVPITTVNETAMCPSIAWVGDGFVIAWAQMSAAEGEVRMGAAGAKRVAAKVDEVPVLTDTYKIYSAKVTATGTILWTKKVSNANNAAGNPNQVADFWPTVVSDDAGGALIAWMPTSLVDQVLLNQAGVFQNQVAPLSLAQERALVKPAATKPGALAAKTPRIPRTRLTKAQQIMGRAAAPASLFGALGVRAPQLGALKAEEQYAMPIVFKRLDKDGNFILGGYENATGLRTITDPQKKVVAMFPSMINLGDGTTLVLWTEQELQAEANAPQATGFRVGAQRIKIADGSLLMSTSGARGTRFNPNLDPSKWQFHLFPKVAYAGGDKIAFSFMEAIVDPNTFIVDTTIKMSGADIQTQAPLWGLDGVEVSGTKSFNANNDTQYSIVMLPSISALKNGNFAALWQDFNVTIDPDTNDMTYGSNGIYAQMIKAADGSKLLAEPYRVDPGVSRVNVFPILAMPMPSYPGVVNNKYFDYVFFDPAQAGVAGKAVGLQNMISSMVLQALLSFNENADIFGNRIGWILPDVPVIASATSPSPTSLQFQLTENSGIAELYCLFSLDGTLLGTSTTPVVDMSGLSNTVYQVYPRAFNITGWTEKGANFTACTNAEGVTGLTMSGNVLSWNAATINPGLTRYEVARRIVGTSDWEIVSGPNFASAPGVTSYTDTTMLPNQTYNYRVRPYNQLGNLNPEGPLLTANRTLTGPSQERPRYQVGEGQVGRVVRDRSWVGNNVMVRMTTASGSTLASVQGIFTNLDTGAVITWNSSPAGISAAASNDSYVTIPVNIPTGTYSMKVIGRDSNNLISENTTIIRVDDRARVADNFITATAKAGGPISASQAGAADFATISYQLTKDPTQPVTLIITDVGGQVLMRRVIAPRLPGAMVGYNAVEFDGVTPYGPKISRGLHLLQIMVDGKLTTGAMMVK